LLEVSDDLLPEAEGRQLNDLEHRLDRSEEFVGCHPPRLFIYPQFFLVVGKPGRTQPSNPLLLLTRILGAHAGLYCLQILQDQGPGGAGDVQFIQDAIGFFHEHVYRRGWYPQSKLVHADYKAAY
jgi:hypothetical protein